ncbi:hypothetical protein [Tunturiibacter lichenicola]|uniref:hypothetical protein n=1 Tax=Tunturiibacter lichenicola TaxID=2051959 RepID=UPI003D9B956B
MFDAEACGAAKPVIAMTGLKSLCLWVVLVAPLAAQSFSVKIVRRQTGGTRYLYQVSGHLASTARDGSNCYGTAYGSFANVNCNALTTTNTDTTAPQVFSLHLTGATYSLLLPDGRIAVVNCVSKFEEHFAGPARNRRSCRMPPVDDIQADFKGKNAKLSWPVSPDGKKANSETYTILVVFQK